ncbi:hypothetical protein [Nocardioides sp. GY 10127]|uniref:hypothetical protein n=1 Tax=Nocardioides sp. GY 10127 TaxID=2569762 RepID=UPI0010A911BC|nr:hypothetical protein [Nocardioides sp. GY 10127]TIC84203.1 hypothetical protein E8D37_05275 [Nocardioides sp. GY 10127]
MAERIVLHVGLMKSGTTYLQGLMEASSDLLADQGVLFPGPTWDAQLRAVNDFLGLPHSRPGDWEALCADVRAHPGTVLLSMEFLANLGPARVRRLVADLGGARTEAVLTVRDLGRSVPALWQETCKNRRTWTWSEYVEGVRRGDDGPGPGRHFWRRCSFATIAARWAQVLGGDRVTVVTVPPPGADPDLLWARFREAVGLADAPWRRPPRANESLGGASARLMRLLNERSGDLGSEQYLHRFKALAKYTLGADRDSEPRIGFVVPDWLAERSRAEVSALAGSGVRLVGDLDELTPVDTVGSDPETLPTEDLFDAALRALEQLLREGDDALRPPSERTGEEGVHAWPELRDDLYPRQP